MKKGFGQMSLRWVCFGLLFTATVFRFADWWIFARQPETAEAAEAPKESVFKGYPTMYYTLPETNTALFSQEDEALVAVDNRSGLSYDAGSLITAPLKIDTGVDGPIVLIIHTHAMEAYTMTDTAVYEPSSAYRTRDTEHNVVRVGQEIADELNALGIETLHDTTLNDSPGYDDSYERTAAVIKRYLAEYPSIQMVIDVHRDAVADSSGNEIAMSTELYGQRAARLLLVMGTNAAGLEHPNWHDNLSFALKLQAMCEKTAPGLFRELSLRSERYNEHLTPCSILLEVGTAGNTLEEALLSAKYFAGQLAILLQG